MDLHYIRHAPKHNEKQSEECPLQVLLNLTYFMIPFTYKTYVEKTFILDYKRLLYGNIIRCLSGGLNERGAVDRNSSGCVSSLWVRD